ncbi:MAG: DUF4190 domain-containing protein [Chloroflexi bacterium]|nr:DUF4190 domain-containing protein [Chloroflexota bacterium]MBU1661831.1 DUF4190 domain-containing protein [Chloroflexota bacterium]
MSDYPSFSEPHSRTPSVVPNSTTAMISLVAGILGLTLFPFIGSVIALITGSMAKKEINASAGTLGGEGLATAGIIMGWIGVAIGVIGFCIGGIIILLSLGMFGIAAQEMGTLLPFVFAVL